MQVPEEKYLHFCNWPPLSILTSTIVVVASTGDVGFQGTVLLQQMNKINITEYTQLSLSPSCTQTHTEKKIGNRECRKGLDFFLFFFFFFSSPFKYLLLPSAAVKIIIFNNTHFCAKLVHFTTTSITPSPSNGGQGLFNRCTNFTMHCAQQGKTQTNKCA